MVAVKFDISIIWSAGKSNIFGNDTSEAKLIPYIPGTIRSEFQFEFIQMLTTTV